MASVWLRLLRCSVAKNVAEAKATSATDVARKQDYLLLCTTKADG